MTQTTPDSASTPPYVNVTTRQFDKRISPLAQGMIAPGHYLTDAGTVAPISKPPVVEEEEETSPPNRRRNRL